MDFKHLREIYNKYKLLLIKQIPNIICIILMWVLNIIRFQG